MRGSTVSAAAATVGGASAVKPRRYPGRAVVVFLITVLLGPPIGGLAVYLWAALMGPDQPPAPNEFAQHLGALTVFALLGYVFGAAQALVSAGIIATRAYFRGGGTLLDCLGAALAVSAVAATVLIAAEPDNTTLAGVLAAAGLAAAVPSWVVMRALGVGQRRVDAAPGRSR